MPSASQTKPFTTGHKIRRRRITTSCTTCRDRRVKCDRVQPTCSPCKKGAKSCKYIDQEPPKVEFVNSHQMLSQRDDSPSGTWRAVIENQAKIVKNSDETKDGAPFWAVAEADEPSNSQTAYLPKPKCIPISALGEDFLAALTRDLPSSTVCAALFDSFLEGIHPAVPVCHIPTLKQQYSDFWTTVSPNYSVESLALILAVLYTGAANSTPIFVEQSIPILTLHEEIFNSIDIASYQNRDTASSIQLLQGCIIMNTYKASNLSPFAAYGFLPQLIRFAQSLRLYSEPKKATTIELEVRRRIWWHLVFIDIESTVATGLPPIIHRSGFTTQLPSLVQDHVISSEGIPEELSPMMIAVQGHFLWAHRMQMWFETLPSQEEVTNFKTSIENLVGLIPDRPENQWPRTYLQMQIDRAYCMLGLRFWQLDQYKDTDCHSEVVKTARSFLNHYLALSTPPSDGKFVWFVPGLIQPLHAIIILLMHISTCSNIVLEETLSRSLLDIILQIRIERILKGTVLPPKVKIEGDVRANPRYVILVELRKRVWQKVGWENDGKGMDPWGGGTLEGDDSKTFASWCCMMATAKGTMDPLLVDNCNDGTGLDGLDNILSSDPMDLFQWDEWESLTSEFFAS